MATELNSSENILFGHKAELKGQPGKILVTDVKIFFTPSSGEGTVQIPWSNIRKTQKNNPSTDKHGRVGFRVECVSGPPCNFFLIGDRLEVMAQEQMKLHSVTTSILASQNRTSSTITTSKTKKRTISQDDGASAVNDSDEVRKAKLLRTRKIQILEADQHLGKSYRDLVETSKVIDDDEFWATHMPDFAAKLHVDEDYARDTKKGRLNSLKAANGKINLTNQDRKDILENEPIVRLAYDELVPNQKSEKEFWTLYIEKTYFKHAQNKSRQAVELFAGFEEKARRRQLCEGRGDLGALVTKAIPDRAVSRSSGTKFDILHNYHDFDIKESYDGEDRMLAESKHLTRINNESKMVLATDENVKGPDKGPISREEVAELRPPSIHKYAPLKIRRQELDSADPPLTNGGAPGVKKSAFAKAKSAFGKSTGASEVGVGGGPVVPPRSMKDVLESLPDQFPDPSRALTCFAGEKTLLREQAAVAERMARAEAFLRSNQKIPSSDLILGDSDDNLDVRFRKDMEETYSNTIELLRHFYAILLREGAGKPTKGSPGAEKVEKLLQRLEATKDQLVTKSRAMKDRLQDRKLEASLALLNEVIRLVGRGDQWWQNYKARVHI